MDLGVLIAVCELAKGEPEGVAEILDKGNPNTLQELSSQLAKDPEARKRMATALRGGKVRKPGKPPMPNHDSELFLHVAYWIGRGEDDKWQDSKAGWNENTVWHLALSTFPESYGMASSLRQRWRKCITKQKQKPTATWALSSTGAFIDGVRDALPNKQNGEEALDFIAEQNQKARRYGFKIHAHPLWIYTRYEAYELFPELLEFK